MYNVYSAVLPFWPSTVQWISRMASAGPGLRLDVPHHSAGLEQSVIHLAGASSDLAEPVLESEPDPDCWLFLFFAAALCARDAKLPLSVLPPDCLASAD